MPGTPFCYHMVRNGVPVVSETEATPPSMTPNAQFAAVMNWLQRRLN